MHRRVGVVWAVAAWVSVTAVWAVPVDDQDLKVEHREAPIDITSNLPSASNDMFIWNGPDGSYRFGMQGQDQWRVESRDASGQVQGRYVYRTPDGQTVDVTYGAGAQGYRAVGDAIPGGAAPLKAAEDTTPEGVGNQRINDESRPYGALVSVGQDPMFPNGNGVTTYSDDDVGAIITESESGVRPQFDLKAVFPLMNFPGTKNLFLAPPLVNNEQIVAAAIPV